MSTPEGNVSSDFQCADSEQEIDESLAVIPCDPAETAATIAGC